MVERRICSFCGGNVEPGTGRMFVKRDGSTFFFCRTKCQRNLLDLGRNPRTTRWTVHHLRERGVEAKREAVGVGVLKEAKKPAAKAPVAAKKPAPAEKKVEPKK